ncbi:MAG: carboxypeptidase regulatory-like domain-containing protein [Anaerolineales bacterium]|nr:carboxypeptidase regulatory-like domain-containing protein [Anaerolineales bacterium]
MNTARRFTIIFLALIILMASWGKVNAQSTDVLYFPETRHYVKGVFLQFYNAAKDPKLVYGHPITEQIVARDGKTVQYFQRARFELTPDNRVQLTPLGTLTYKPQSQMPVQSANGCELYSQFYVCFTFLDFYKANGGPNQFGNPISPFESADGLIVQYFEGARFEWRAYQGTAKWVVISDLGRVYFDQQKEDPAYLKPAPPPDATISSVLSIKARAFVLKAVTLKNGQQTIYTIVQDQASVPVENATVKAIVHLSNNTNQEYTFTTNARGIGQVSFNFSDQKPGELISIDITVDYQGLTGTTTTSYRIWF